MSSRTQETRASSPDIGTGRDDDVVGESSPHGTGRSCDRRSRSEEAGVLVRAHDELVRKVDIFVKIWLMLSMSWITHDVR